MSSEAPDFGYKPSNRYQKEQVLYFAWAAATGSSMSFAEWQATNMDLACQPALTVIEEYEGKMVKLCTELFNEFRTQKLAIEGSFGASREGWLNALAPYCKGVQIVDYYKNPLRAQNWPVDKKINGKNLWEIPIKEIYTEMIKDNATDVIGYAPGEFAIYFDELADDAPIVELFKRLIGPAEYTLDGKTKINVGFSDGTAREYNYTNVKEANYTKINLQATITYKREGLTYRDGDIVRHIKDNFAKSYNIGNNVYLRALFCLPQFDGIADIDIKWQSISGGGAWSAGPIISQPGQRFAVENVEVEVA